MITIFSRTNDGTTTEVINWIKYINKKVEVIRIDSDSEYLSFDSYDDDKDKFTIKIDDKIIDLAKSKVNWYRKGGRLFKGLVKKELNRDYFQDNFYNLKSHLTNELLVLENYLHHYLESKSYSLGSVFNATLNKLIVLEKAKKLGLKIPSVSIVNSKVKLNEVFNSNENIITKALSDGVYSFGMGKSYYSYTEKIDRNTIGFLSDKFFPSLLQNQINKKYEIRTFYLDGNFFSMAIFSQNNEQTKVDFRKYDGVKPNRNVPFILPKHIENILIKLFEDLCLNTGSADLIVDENDEFVFLEINPVGQFSMVSFPCNFYLEKKVAELLLKKI